MVHTLISIRGARLWTAQWLLIQALDRPDGFPHSDLALQRTLGRFFNSSILIQSEEALEYSRRWKPFRSYVTTYLFAAICSGRLNILSPAGKFRV